MILLLTPMLGMALAEQATAAAVPIMTLGVALGFYAAAVRRMFGSIEALVAGGFIITILPLMSQLLPMRIDHHGWQLVCFFAAVWGLSIARCDGSHPWCWELLARCGWKSRLKPALCSVAVRAVSASMDFPRAFSRTHE